MNPRGQDDLSQFSMLELFRAEAEAQTAMLTSGLLELERAPSAVQTLETLMRAAHSIKGAARIVNLHAAVRVAHAMEDCLVAAQKGQIRLARAAIDVLLRGVDLLAQLGRRSEASLATWESDCDAEIRGFLDAVADLLSPGAEPPGVEAGRAGGPRSGARPGPGGADSGLGNLPAQSLEPGGGLTSEDAGEPRLAAGPARAPAEAGAAMADTGRGAELPVALPVSGASAVLPPSAPVGPAPLQARVGRGMEPPERVVRLTAESLNRLLGLAGESLVESRWLRPFSDSLQRLKRRQTELADRLEHLRQTMDEPSLPEGVKIQLAELSSQLAESQQFLAERIQELDSFDRRTAHLSHRLYLEVLRTRMRPFGDGVRRFPRMVRDLARMLGKEVRLEITGESTQVDRDILERLETPLAHLLRNAVDHGCEPSDQRRRANKSPECVIRLEARHTAGMLMVTVADDGAGVRLEQLRRAIIEKQLAAPAVAEKLSEAELLEFLFLPGFTLKGTVTEISGRGVGLDAVQNMVKSVRGTIRIGNQPGCGLRVQLQLPLTLSVLRALLVEVAGEPYAVPLSQIHRTLKLPRGAVWSLEGRQHFHFLGQPVGLLSAQQVLDLGESPVRGEELPVVVVGDRNVRYGLVVDRLLGERELVVQPLDPRLGKVRDISAAALMEDGAPVLILDVDDLLRSIEKLAESGRLGGSVPLASEAPGSRPKRVLAVDDSLTVRELERKMLAGRGYLVEVAVDGMDGWNAVRAGQYDLVITDVDMPRMDGIELATRIKSDPRLKSMPVVIVSYKDREEDRMRGLEAGADYYLTKGSFHDETLLQAVADLIGEPET
jgi:two-component system sensor histidine kinase and response regulator WspE